MRQRVPIRRKPSARGVSPRLPAGDGGFLFGLSLKTKFRCALSAAASARSLPSYKTALNRHLQFTPFFLTARYGEDIRSEDLTTGRNL